LWNSLAITYRDWGKYEEAMTHHQEALSRYEALEDAANVADVHCELGITYRNWGKFPESLEKLNDSYRIYNELQIKGEVASLLRHQALTLPRMEKYAEAVTRATEGLKLAETFDLLEQAAWCHEALVEVYGAWRKAEQAREHFNQAEVIYKALGREVDTVDVKVKLSKVERAEGNNEAAEEFLKEALNTYQAFNRPVKIAKTLRELGKLHQATDQESQAREEIQSSIDLFTQMLMESEVIATQMLLTKEPND
jgi:tetratricopeptide (TPR) repeat protein